MLKFPICLSVLILLLIGCGTNPSDTDDESLVNKTDTVYHLLIFKKEQKLEVWKVGYENTFLDSFKIKRLPQLPIGHFDISFDKENKNLLIDFPNEFYKTKAYKFDSDDHLTIGTNNLPERFFQKIESAPITEIIIFPNDSRSFGDLIPCFACPHWMAEIYAFLNYKKKEYI